MIEIGHDTLSINSRSSLNALYGPAQAMEKSEAYRLPGQKKAVCLFYKQDKVAHSDRKRVWNAALTPTRRVLTTPESSIVILILLYI